jgi:lysophospholipase L1-like esterase
MKIVLFGDSMLARFGKERIQKLEATVPQCDIYNCATGGWDSNDCALKAPYIASLKPDAVIVSVGTNDAAPWKQVPIQAFEKNLNSILDSFQNKKIVSFLPSPVNERKQKGEHPRTNELLKKYFDVAKEVCTIRSVSYIDSWAIFSPLLEQEQDYHVDDGVHFNDFGDDLLTDHLTEALNSK